MGSEELYDRLFNERLVTRDGVRPCPFCGTGGAAAKMLGQGTAVARCPKCETYGPWIDSGGFMAALDAWDRRDAEWTGILSSQRRGATDHLRSRGKRLEGYLPCPFCGSTLLFNEPLTKTSGGTCCVDCGAAGPVVPFNQDALKAAWNDRKQPQPH